MTILIAVLSMGISVAILALAVCLGVELVFRRALRIAWILHYLFLFPASLAILRADDQFEQARNHTLLPSYRVSVEKSAPVRNHVALASFTWRNDGTCLRQHAIEPNELALNINNHLQEVPERDHGTWYIGNRWKGFFRDSHRALALCCKRPGIHE
jgi:hypothetical protein